MTYHLKSCSSIEEIGQENWDAQANPCLTDTSCGIPFDPFLSYNFLYALEKSGSVSADTGWAPYHLVLENAANTVLGVAPMYLKNHSQGEYVFDYNWADAFDRAGGRYYPKLQVSIPFTPVTGRRLLTGSREHAEKHEKYLLSGIMQIAEGLKVSSVHITFANKPQYRDMGKMGFLQRTHNQFHWVNRDYTTFDDFLSQLSYKKRKNIKRERRLALASGISIECLSGAEISAHHWDAFYQFYIDTSSRKWAAPYLTRAFFSLVGQTMSSDILLILARRNGRYIAGAINFIGGECLFGRNWGCLEHHPMLHFEVCYYQAIEYAIKHKLQRVEAGAQGQHKLARGYLPTHTYSTHWIVDPGFNHAVRHFLNQERRHIDEEVDFLDTHSPFRRAK